MNHVNSNGYFEPYACFHKAMNFFKISLCNTVAFKTRVFKYENDVIHI